MTTAAQILRVLFLTAAMSLLTPARLPAEETATVPIATAAATTTAAVAAQTSFSREQLVAGLTRAIATHFNLEGDLQIELLRAWAPPARSAAVWDLSVIEFPASPASSMMMRCRLAGDGAVAVDATFVVKAQLWRDAWATRQPLASGALFDVTALETRRVDLLRERDVLPASVGDRTYVFSRSIPAGRMLTWRDVSRRPFVKKGELVEVTANDGTLIITMKALALESGAQGETVTVRNPESRKNFTALIIDENRVQVRF